MRFPALLTIPAAVALLLGPAVGGAQGRDWSFDFRMTDSAIVDDASVNGGVTTGRAVVSKSRARLDMRGTSRASSMPRMAPGDEVSMIVEKNGRLITYLLPKTREYMQFNPAGLVTQMQQMMQDAGTAMKLDISGPDPKLENLGKGPVILGHATVHYRLTTAMKITTAMTGKRESVEMSSTTDQYFAPGLSEIMDPFAAMKSMSEMSGMFGGASKAYIDKMQAVRLKLPRATELRAVQRTHITQGGMESDIKTIREITSIKRLTAGPELFVVPAGYRKIDMPGRIRPPRR